MSTCLTPTAEVQIQSAEYLADKWPSGHQPLVVGNTHRFLVDLIALLHNHLKVHAYIQALPGDVELLYVLVAKCAASKAATARAVCNAFMAGMQVYHCYA